MKKQKGKTAFVLWGATDIGPPHFSADILWRTGFKAPDPFYFVEIDDKTFILTSPLELERARKESNADEVVNSHNYSGKVRTPIANFLRKQNVGKVIVNSKFPVELFLMFKKYFEVVMAPDPFYPKRAVKTMWEIGEIQKAQFAVQKAVNTAMEYLRSCVVAGEVIKDLGSPEFGMSSFIVTSEMVRRIIDRSLFNDGFLGVDTIVSGGLQSADPHCMGSGPLRPDQPIVMDVFPLSLKTHYYADMTRTVFKGEPSPELKRMYNAVLETQNEAICEIAHGVNGNDIYNNARLEFDMRGYPTNMKTSPMEGFFHGVGHGVGLDIHEPPWISSGKCILEEGNVVTVEPGLYYPKAHDHLSYIPVGGIRIEDMVLVTKDGCRNLTTSPKDLNSMIVP